MPHGAQCRFTCFILFYFFAIVSRSHMCLSLICVYPLHLRYATHYTLDCIMFQYIDNSVLNNEIFNQTQCGSS